MFGRANFQESYYGKRPNAQQSRTKETQAIEKAGTGTSLPRRDAEDYGTDEQQEPVTNRNRAAASLRRFFNW
jgi:hypothetical protein